MSKTITNRPYIYRGKQRKYLYEHTCFCCEQTFLSTMKRKIYFCPPCLKDSKCINAAMQVKHNIHRAEKAGLPATLTSQQWLATLNEFSWKCAYCQLRPYYVLEHFIPINLGGGTTSDNVLPSCRSCNCLKSFYHPEQTFQSDTLNRLTLYLQTRRMESEATA
jgi:5-methylcytosine-specific restriction endonuclease McrA